MIREKAKVPMTLRPTTVAKILGFHELFFLCPMFFWHLSNQEKNYPKKVVL